MAQKAGWEVKGQCGIQGEYGSSKREQVKVRWKVLGVRVTGPLGLWGKDKGRSH